MKLYPHQEKFLALAETKSRVLLAAGVALGGPDTFEELAKRKPDCLVVCPPVYKKTYQDAGATVVTPAYLRMHREELLPQVKTGWFSTVLLVHVDRYSNRSGLEFRTLYQVATLARSLYILGNSAPTALMYTRPTDTVVTWDFDTGLNRFVERQYKQCDLVRKIKKDSRLV